MRADVGDRLFQENSYLYENYLIPLETKTKDMCRRLFRLPRKGFLALSCLWNEGKFRVQDVRLGNACRIEGTVYLRLAESARVEIGNNVHVVGGYGINRIGGNAACCLAAGDGAELRIGDGAGISNSCLWAMERIEIGAHANIGAGCVILDHDAHSLDALQRRDYAIDSQNIAKDPVVIGEDVLLGARCIVLKGVHIGDRSIVGAGSVVTCDIPSDEIWAGNPARKIRSL